MGRPGKDGNLPADDGKPTTKKGLKVNIMKQWTVEELYNLWRNRGYSKKEAQAMAEKDYNEMHRRKSQSEQHQIMQEMLYN